MQRFSQALPQRILLIHPHRPPSSNAGHILCSPPSNRFHTLRLGPSSQVGRQSASPSSPTTTVPCRIFTTSAPLHLYARGTRPSIPYLTTHASRNGHRLFAIRTLSTQLKYELRLGLYWGVMITVGFAGIFILYAYMRTEWLDRLYPSPEEWGFMPRDAWRKAKEEYAEILYGKTMVDWGGVGWGYRRVMHWCELGTITTYESWQDHLPQNPDWESIDVPGIDKEYMKEHPVSGHQVQRIGHDLTSKSEPYRRAYYQALMGLAETAEVTEDHVRDKKRGILFPRDQVVGPSNPYPKPIWPGSPDAPLEEDTEDCYDSPSLFYARILTTKGFTPRQHMNAALAYSSYLAYRGDNTTAKYLLDYSLNLACSSFSASHPDIPITSIIDPKSSMIKSNAPLITQNLLTTTAALAQHHALAGDIPHALNIYLSMLRARRSAPLAPSRDQYIEPGPDYSLQSIGSMATFLGSLFTKPSMGPPPPSGDEPFQRTKYNNCDEAAIMAYVAELLFASSEASAQAKPQRRRDALAWTRDAVELAESGHRDGKLDVDSRYQCSQCLTTGLENWTKMVRVLSHEKEARERARGLGVASAESRQSRLKPGFWEGKAKEEEELRRQEIEAQKGWWAWVPFVSDGVKPDPMLDDTDWGKELQRVDQRRAIVAEERMMHVLNRQIATRSKLFVA